MLYIYFLLLLFCCCYNNYYFLATRTLFSSGFMEFQYLIRHRMESVAIQYVRQTFTLLLYRSAYATKSYSLSEFWKVYCDLLVTQSVRLGFQSHRNSLFLLTFYVLLVMLTRRHSKRKENFVELWHFIVCSNKYMHPWNVEKMVAGNHVMNSYSNPFVNYLQRDIIGIGGTWSDFIDYLTASIKSEDVKLVLEGQPKSDGDCKFLSFSV